MLRLPFRLGCFPCPSRRIGGGAKRSGMKPSVILIRLRDVGLLAAAAKERGRTLTK
jgi:hypothetical protein